MIFIAILVLDQNEEGGKQDEVCQQVKEKIAQRKGVTSIVSFWYSNTYELAI